MQLAAWVAAALIFLSFFMKTIMPLRTLAIASNEQCLDEAASCKAYLTRHFLHLPHRLPYSHLDRTSNEEPAGFFLIPGTFGSK